LHPLIRARLILPEKRGFYEKSLSIIAAVLPSKKILSPLECILIAENAGVHCFEARSGTEIDKSDGNPRATPFHPKFTLCRA
jgi:hypothetical protein